MKPYKTNVAASFPWAEGGGADGPHGFGESGNPGGYFHLLPGEVYHLTFGRSLADEDVMGPQLVDLIADSFLVAVPVMRWLAIL